MAGKHDKDAPQLHEVNVMVGNEYWGETYIICSGHTPAERFSGDTLAGLMKFLVEHKAVKKWKR